MPTGSPAAFSRFPTRGFDGVFGAFATPSTGICGRSKNGAQVTLKLNFGLPSLASYKYQGIQSEAERKTTVSKNVCYHGGK